jgi:Protein of unknown function (DUF2442)
MGHRICRVEHFEIVGPYTLALRFDDGTKQRINFRPVLEGEVFAPLQDLDVFNAVQLDSAFGTVQWPNGADFDPETLHDWPKYEQEFVAMARRWAAASEARSAADSETQPTPPPRDQVRRG